MSRLQWHHHSSPSHDNSFHSILNVVREKNEKEKKCSESPTSDLLNTRVKQRNSPCDSRLEQPDKYSEVATLGDPDEIGSIASLSSINERIIEVREKTIYFYFLV